MEIRTVTTTAQLSGLQHEWEALEERDPATPYHVRHRFVRAWWEAYESKPGVDLNVVCARQNNRLVGVAPLSIRDEKRGGEPVRVLRFASHGDYLGVLVDVGAQVNPDTVFKSLMSHLESDVRWDRVSLINVPASSPFAAYLLKSRYNRHFSHYMENPYIDLRGATDFEEFDAERVPKNARKYRNKLLREVDLGFRVVRGNDEDVLDRIAALHRAEKEFLVEEQGRTERHSLFDDPHRAAHIANVFNSTDDAVTFLYEEPGGGLVGYRTCFLDGRVLLSWNSAYNPRYHEYRIGKVLQYDILRHVIEQRLADRFDLGAGRYAWKFEWTSDFTATYRLQLTTERTRPATAEPTAAAKPEQSATPRRRSAPQEDRAGSGLPEDGGQRTPAAPAPRRAQITRDVVTLVKGARHPRALARRLRRSPRVRRSAGRAKRLLLRNARPLVAPLRARGAAGGDGRGQEARNRAVRVLRGVLRRVGLDARGRVRPRGRPSSTPSTAPAVWYVPHPDDEALFMAGSISQSRGRRNVVVLMTRGGASNAVKKINAELDAPITREAFMESRIREFRAAMAVLGVAESDVVLLNHPDGGLDAEEIHEIVLNMERQFPGARHHTMSYLDPHRDHRAAGEALLAAYRDGEVTECEFHLPVPLVDEDLGSPVPFDEEALAVKRAVVGEYARWDPANGRYAVATHSVPALVQRQTHDPTERVHGPGYRP